MTFLKFINKAHAERMLAGHIRITNIDYYRIMDAVFNEKWIGDRNDGAEKYEVEDIENGEGNRSTIALAEEALGLMPESKMTMIGNKYTSAPADVFLFCMSNGSLEEFADLFGSDRSGSAGYDCCISIKSPIMLARSIRDGIIEGPDRFKNRRAGDLFTQFGCGEVVYGKKFEWPRDGTIPQSWGFSKEKIFEQQKEYRIAFYPNQEIGVDYLDVFCPFLPGLIEVIWKAEKKYHQSKQFTIDDVKNTAVKIVNASPRDDVDLLRKSLLRKYWDIRRMFDSREIDILIRYDIRSQDIASAILEEIKRIR